jgi:hypothetical protein
MSVSDSLLQQFQSAPSLLLSLREEYEAESFGANHRNVDIFHFLLNGTHASVPGSLGIFSSWCGDMEMYVSYRIDDECFGMYSRDVTKLLSALEDLTEEKIRERWVQWQVQKGIDPEKDDDPDFFPESFGYFQEYCAQTVQAGNALIWVTG